MFDDMLISLAKLGSSSDSNLLKSALGFLYQAPVPNPAQHIRMILSEEHDYNFRRNSQDELVYGLTHFWKLLHCLDAFSIVRIVVAMMLERRMIFISSKPGYLGDCVQAAVSLLYPFQWQVILSFHFASSFPFSFPFSFSRNLSTISPSHSTS
jgi:hypothetical protein